MSSFRYHYKGKDQIRALNNRYFVFILKLLSWFVVSVSPVSVDLAESNLVFISMSQFVSSFSRNPRYLKFPGNMQTKFEVRRFECWSSSVVSHLQNAKRKKYYWTRDRFLVLLLSDFLFPSTFPFRNWSQLNVAYRLIIIFSTIAACRMFKLSPN